MHAEAPKGFDLLHKAIYKALCKRLDDAQIAHYRVDYEEVFQSVREIHNAVCDAVYVDVDRPAVDHGEEN